MRSGGARAGQAVGSLFSLLRKLGQHWLAYLRSERGQTWRTTALVVGLVLGVIFTFIALTVMPILGLAVAAGAAVYVYLTRDTYLPIKTQRLRKGELDTYYNNRRKSKSTGSGRRRVAWPEVLLWDTFERVATVMLMSVGGSLLSAAQRPIAGMITTMLFAIFLVFLCGAPRASMPRARRRASPTP